MRRRRCVCGVLVDAPDPRCDDEVLCTYCADLLVESERSARRSERRIVVEEAKRRIEKWRARINKDDWLGSPDQVLADLDAMLEETRDA